MKKIKFAIVGNCQARPLAMVIERLTKGIAENTSIIITHLAKIENAESDLAGLSSADIIFSQLVQDGYQTSHITTKNLINQFGSKIVSFPNLFFLGHSPRLCYVTGRQGVRIMGPLHEYQFEPIFRAWALGLTSNECLNQINESANLNSLEKMIEDSFNELEQREKGLDIQISQRIRDSWLAEKLFFSFNHPTAKLLIDLALLLMKAALIRPQEKLDANTFGEPLGKIEPPILEFDACNLGLRFQTTNNSKGLEIFLEDGILKFGKGKVYSLDELIQQTYFALDAQKVLIDNNVRITPNFK